MCSVHGIWMAETTLCVEKDQSISILKTFCIRFELKLYYLTKPFFSPN